MTEPKTIKCAFCQGKGKDPFGIMSQRATCQVCGGRGKVSILQPYVSCAHCRATGVSPGSRNVCTACQGRGAVTVADGKKVCPKCGGSGNAPESNLPCSVCGGKGVG
jgi:DnaJ-class molecular chaperone